MEKRICSKCFIEKPIEEFVLNYDKKRKDLYRKVCVKCKGKAQRISILSSPERHNKTKENLKKYHRKHRESGKVKAYRVVDKRKGRKSITLEEFRTLLFSTPYCYYCGETNNYILGLDRKDNTLGHEIANVVICCEKCNHFLTDIPFEAKLVLKEGMKQIKEQNLFKNWEIKTKRHKI